MPRGFTLIELLLALGLFTISIAMVACLFPAAIFQAKAADEHTMAAIISENAMAIIRARLTDSRLKNQDPNNLRASAIAQVFEQLDVNPNINPANPTGIDLDANDCLYRYSPATRQFGWTGLVRRLGNPTVYDPNANDYQFVILPYAVNRGQADPNLTQIQVQVEVTAEMTTAALGVPIQVGAPLIRNAGPIGRYAYIVGTTVDAAGNTRAILSDTFGFATPSSNAAVPVWYCQTATGDKTPVLSCVMFRTSLRP